MSLFVFFILLFALRFLRLLLLLLLLLLLPLLLPFANASLFLCVLCSSHSLFLRAYFSLVLLFAFDRFVHCVYLYLYLCRAFYFNDYTICTHRSIYTGEQYSLFSLAEWEGARVNERMRMRRNRPESESESEGSRCNSIDSFSFIVMPLRFLFSFVAAVLFSSNFYFSNRSISMLLPARLSIFLSSSTDLLFHFFLLLCAVFFPLFLLRSFIFGFVYLSETFLTANFSRANCI